MRRTRHLVPGLALATALAAGAVAVSGQQPQNGPQAPVFRGGANFVYVDAYPRRDGHLVEGLTAADFQISEDGKPQKVETFEFVRNEPSPPDTERRDPTSQEDGNRQAADPKNRVFVVYIDVFHVGQVNTWTVHQPLLDFLTRTIGANDLFGVMTPETPVRDLVFVRSTTTLQSELESNFTWGVPEGPIAPRSDEEWNLLRNCQSADNPGLGEALVRLHREDELATSLENLMARLGALRDERKNVLFLSEGWRPLPAQTQLMTKESVPAGTPIGAGPGGRITAGGDPRNSQDRSACDSAIRRLSNIDFERRFRDLLGLAIRANVTFYPVDVGGLRLTPTPDTLLTLAENTGGHAIMNTNDIRGAMQKVADDVSGYYLLGYYTTNAALDGRFRKIEVKTTRPGVSMSARPGYFAPTADAAHAMDAAAAKAAAGPSAVEREVASLSRLQDDAQVFGYGTASATGLSLVAEVASAQQSGGHWQSGGKAEFKITSAAGATVTATADIDPAARGTLVRVPLDRRDSGPWKVNVHVSGSDGTIEDRFEVAPPASAFLGDPLIYRAGASPRAPLRPAADFQFRRTERLHVEWPELKALDQRILRVLDRRGQPLPLTPAVTERPDGPPTLVADVPLAPLAEGDYVLEATAGSAGQTEQHLLAFRLVRQ